MILAPGINVKRTPACGRNFEYFSEDPYLISELAVPLIEGIEESDVSACVKHFALNQQEEERHWVNVEIDERTLREIYLPGFEAAVKKAHVSSLMGAYNLFRGEHCCENEKLLGTILRKEWGYDGVIVSDWGAVHHTTAAALSPLDIEMSVTPDFDNYCFAKPLKEKIASGEIPESVVDEKVRHILKLMVKLKMITLTERNEACETASRDDKAVCVQTSDRREQRNAQGSGKTAVHVRVSSNAERKRGCYNTPEHRSAILDVARESIVLLKNEEHRLPLAPSHAVSLETIFEAETSVSDKNKERNLITKDVIPQEKCVVRVTVKNTGTYAGKEIVQLYVGGTDVSAENPVKELKGFERVSLQPGEEKEVTFLLGKSAFAHYDTAVGAFVTKPGNYTIYIGSSCGDIRQKIKLDIA